VQLGETLIRPADEMTMVYVPGVTFEMGSLPDDDRWGPHTVTLDSFWIDQTEVTNAQFAAFLNIHGNQFEGGITWLEIEQMENAQIEIKDGIFLPETGKDKYPVVEVSWFGMSAYCEWVGARLPTEAEWEFAARGPENNVYPWENKPPTCELAQFGGCGDHTVQVGSLEGDSWVGAKDMAGNVWEWTSDYYAVYPSEPKTNPTGPETGEWWMRAIRGGSYSSAPDTLHTAYRLNGGGSQPNMGFRCAASAPNPVDTTSSQSSNSTLSPSGSSGGVIAFFSNRDGNDEIYTMNADGTGQCNLINNPFSDTDPAWSPDGSQIAFASTRDRNYEVYVMDADGSNMRRLTNHPDIDAHPTWSPDGSQIAFLSRRDGNVEVYLINVDGSNLQRITHNNYDDFEINWSPDGRLIALSSQVGKFGDIYTINIETVSQGATQRTQLTDTEAHDAFPKWSPDGSRIAFITNRDGDGNWEIYVMNSDGSNQRRLTYADGLDGIPTWSPDGTQIAFESDRDGDNEIYVLNVDEALQNPKSVEIIRLTHNEANDQHPDWRPETVTISETTNHLSSAVPPSHAALSDTWVRPIDGAVMVFVEGGTFQMGSTQDEIDAAFALCEQYRGEGQCRRSLFEDEIPAHEITLVSFWIDRNEVTNAQYNRCVEAGGCSPIDCENEFPIDGPVQPVGCVTWPDAQAYCQWAGVRLPTEAEWEYAARGPDGYIFPWGNSFDPTRLNYCDINCAYKWQDRNYNDGYSWPAPVGSFETGVSWCGAQDMAGNSWEWVADWYDPEYYANSPEYNPQGPASGIERVIRGGSAHFFPPYQRSTNRSGISVLAIYASGGFRCAVSHIDG
jgi:formylglycine-generating enzyme required for sulfatase activity